MKGGAIRQHAEWRSLIDVSGPFLALEVLSQVFPQGLPAPETEQDVRAQLRVAFAEWEAEFEEEEGPNQAIHSAWLRFVMEEVLGFRPADLKSGQDLPTSLAVAVPEHGETLRPDLALVVDGKPRLLVSQWPRSQQVDRAPSDSRWAASPSARMMALLHATGVRLGLVTNGDAWMLVHAVPGETTTYATWWADVWRSEPLTLTAFRALVGRPAFFERPDDETLEALFDKSASYAHEVTDQLGLQVRHAVELLVHALDRLDRTEHGAVLKGVNDKTLYEAAVTVMMRLVFLLCAEERKLLLSGNEAWDSNYAVGTLRAQLREAADLHGEEVLERRQSAWARLLSTFRAVFGGVQHNDFQIRAYGGSLFDPDRFPFLEGRAEETRWKDLSSTPPRIDDRTVLHLLDSIQVLQLNGEPVRLSFRALDVEQIGHVYEGLLDHTTVRADGAVLGLQGSKKKEPELRLNAVQDEYRKGKDHFVEWLVEQTGRSAKAIAKDTFEYDMEGLEQDRLLMVCEGKSLYGEVKDYAGLLRRDPNDYPVVYPSGSRYVTEGSDRRSTGTHYTPRSFSEPVVRYSLEPLVYIGPADGRPKGDWKLRTTEELLALRVCDMAMGSGAFLVQACRYLAERVVESWALRTPATAGTPLFAPFADESNGAPSELQLPQDPEERLMLARRLVADRCLYGVDKNPMAVEMAKLSLWLTTLQKDRPFTFLDHALKAGDALVGITSLEQLEQFSMVPKKVGTAVLGSKAIRSWIKDATATREKLERRQVIDIRDSVQKSWWHGQAEQKLAPMRTVANLLTASALWSDSPESALAVGALQASAAIGDLGTQTSASNLADIRDHAADIFKRVGGTEPVFPFHWPIEFPEVFAGSSPGFDAVVGNPPYLGGSRISSELGDSYNKGIKAAYADLVGKIDLAVFFVWQASRILKASGTAGLLTTFRLPDGDNADVGLRLLFRENWRAYRADRNMPWPGDAKTRICRVWFGNTRRPIPFFLDGEAVPGIDFDLRRSEGAPPEVGQADPTPGESSPHKLAANTGMAWQGANPDSLGFMLSDAEREDILRRSPSEAVVIRRYIVGRDLINRPTRDGARWIIDFTGLTEPEARRFPACFEVVQERVYPGRMKLKRKAYRDRWWQFTEPQETAHKQGRDATKVIGISRVTKHVVWEFIDAQHVISAKIAFVPRNDAALLAVLSSTAHVQWALRTSGRFGAGDSFSYSHSDSLVTFPFPESERAKDTGALAELGLALHEHRASICIKQGVGLTALYDQFYDQGTRTEPIKRLRAIHSDIDRHVLKRYGWDDLAESLSEASTATKQSEAPLAADGGFVRLLVGRLMALNHSRHAKEGESSRHSEGRPKNKVPSRKGGAKAETESVSMRDLFEK